MRAALYARVSTERQAERGTIGSQLQLLREHLAATGDELVGEYVDDGHSGARLDRPGLDALRDGAEGGLFERVWCLSPDRLARAYAYQVLVLDELARFGVTVAFTDSPALAPDDPQATLLTQVQGVIAEYEKAKIAERYRRGKLFRARAGEITTWKTAYGYRRIPRSAASGPAHWEITSPKQPSYDASSPTGQPEPPCARSAAGSTPTEHPPRPANPLANLHGAAVIAQRGLHRSGLLQPHRGST
jgi:site-specific DNA recombinase